jgi:hypothetical protein
LSNSVRYLAATSLIVLLTAGTGTPASAAPPDDAAAAAVILDSLTIRLYDNVGLTADDRDRAIASANAILGRAEVEIEWIHCPARRFGKSSPICQTAPARGELLVRLVNAPANDRHDRQLSTRQPLGYSMIDIATGTGALATVFLDRVTRLAGSAAVERTLVLGRTLAHEIGHLILGSIDHSNDGIMREVWTSIELTSGRAQDWLFLPGQGEQMRQARLVNSAAPTAAVENARKPDDVSPDAHPPDPTDLSDLEG